MNRIFIYYSFTGNGDAIADILKNENVSIRKVETTEELPNNKFLSIFIGGFKALIKYKDKLNDFNNNIDSFNEVIIGSPIWCDRLSSPINSVLDKLELGNKKTVFILYSGSGKANNAIKTISKRYTNSRIILLKEPKNNIEGNKELLLRELK